MRTAVTGVVAVALLVAVTAGMPSAQEGGSTRSVSNQQLVQWTKELSNWGRWGKDDEMGTLNLITPVKRRQAAALVKEGFSISLAAELNGRKGKDNLSPFEHTMLSREFDRIATDTHGALLTHIDAMGHRFACWTASGVSEHSGGPCKTTAYNGYSVENTDVMKQGHAKFSIHNLKNGVFTRGILIDLPGLKGVPYLPAGTPIYPGDLEAWEKKAGVKVSAGDALVVRTGNWAARKAGASNAGAGIHDLVFPWLRKRDVAVWVGDSGVGTHFPTVILGMTMIHSADLEALSEAAAARKRWEFLLTVAPLAVPGGTASPVNPIATF